MDLDCNEETIVYDPSRLELDPTSVTVPVKEHTSYGYLTEEIWSWNILLYCELSTLLRLNWTNVGLRRVLNNPFYIQWWQAQAWFLKSSGCTCARGIYYLNLHRFPDFVFDGKGVQSLRDMEIALRSVGRSADMYQDPLRDVHRLPTVDPNRQPQCFGRGILDCWLQHLLIPMPRMLPCPVEDAHDYARMPLLWRTSFPMPDESPEAFRERQFWGAFHPVPDENDRDDETVVMADDWEGPPVEFYEDQSAPPVPPTVRTVWPSHTGPDRMPGPDLSMSNLSGFGELPSVDRLNDWKHRCECEGVDYLDPAQEDMAGNGYSAVKWARRLIYESPVGVQAYPHALCLRKSQLVGRAHRQGTAYIEHLYLPARRDASVVTAHENDEVRLMLHKGLVYFHPVRYENERGDFCNWALSTIAVMQSVEQYLWYDCVNYSVRRIVELATELAREVQADMSPNRLVQRWTELQRACFFNESTWPPVPNNAQAERGRARNAKALDLIFHHSYVEYNRHISRYVDGIVRGNALPTTRGYLLELIPDNGRMYAGQRSEQTLYRELHDAIRMLVYVTLFATSVGPLTDLLTEHRRYTNMSAWLGCVTSLFMFAPGWQRPLTWNPSATGTSASSRVPHIVLEENHRFQELLLFLNRRTLYYHPEPELYQLWQNRNLEVGRLT